MTRRRELITATPATVDRGARIAELQRELAHERAEVDADLVRAIARSTSGHVFTAADLSARRRVDDELRRALDEAGVYSTRSLAKVLQAQAAHPPSVGLVIVRVTRHRGTTVWQMMQRG